MASRFGAGAAGACAGALKSRSKSPPPPELLLDDGLVAGTGAGAEDRGVGRVAEFVDGGSASKSIDVVGAALRVAVAVVEAEDRLEVARVGGAPLFSVVVAAYA